MKKDLISVIIPIYNREKFLKKCIESVISQSEVFTEIILIDDGSSDKSPQICDEYCSLYDNVVVIHNSNHGLSHARNCGLDICNGEYIFFLDSDDFLPANSLSSLLQALKENDADFVIGNLERYSEDGVSKEYIPLSPKYSNKLLSEEKAWHMCVDLDSIIFVVAWGKLYKRFIWEKLRFPIGKTSEDCFVLPQVMNQSSKIFVLDKITYNQILSTDSITRSKPNHNIIDSSESNTVEIAYLISRQYFDVALYRFGQGTRKLIYAKKMLKDVQSQADIKKLYKVYCKLCEKMFFHVNLKTKIRFLLFKTNFTLYTYLREKGAVALSN